MRNIQVEGESHGDRHANSAGGELVIRHRGTEKTFEMVSVFFLGKCDVAILGFFGGSMVFFFGFCYAKRRQPMVARRYTGWPFTRIACTR